MEMLSANQPCQMTKDPLSFEEVRQKFHANLNFAGIKKDKITN